MFSRVLAWTFWPLSFWVSSSCPSHAQRRKATLREATDLLCVFLTPVSLGVKTQCEVFSAPQQNQGQPLSKLGLFKDTQRVTGLPSHTKARTQDIATSCTSRSFSSNSLFWQAWRLMIYKDSVVLSCRKKRLFDPIGFWPPNFCHQSNLWSTMAICELHDGGLWPTRISFELPCELHNWLVTICFGAPRFGQYPMSTKIQHHNRGTLSNHVRQAM